MERLECGPKGKLTLWQRIYRALGFWTYCEGKLDGDELVWYKVVYWVCFPYGHYFRKFDLFRMKYKE